MNKKENRQFSVGDVALLTLGKHSDYGINELVKVVKDFDLKKVIDDWASENASLYQEKIRDYYLRKNNGLKFVDWLIKQGYAEKIEYRELNTGYDDNEVDIIE
ncbi:hypothetical protein K5M76_06540 [Shewanella xiamenensis]|uniref:hypothetical protein n=1 Tax=Shewanella xiamenensis TaxID=332186 RepID=UPI00217D055A|nr:hypothetical protein [Shewanella xiamenensis]MCT8858334.1 hypothetical protein [Shewanella xiamenensis]UWG65880.1 hypothetical protein K5M76_06540 [Shewanella xiamenensis]